MTEVLEHRDVSIENGRMFLISEPSRGKHQAVTERWDLSPSNAVQCPGRTENTTAPLQKLRKVGLLSFNDAD